MVFIMLKFNALSLNKKQNAKTNYYISKRSFRPLLKYVRNTVIHW